MALISEDKFNGTGARNGRLVISRGLYEGGCQWDGPYLKAFL